MRQSERAVAAFLTIFTVASIAGWQSRRPRKAAGPDGYGWTLTFWTLLATGAVATLPRAPGAVVSCVLALNVLVAALYYSLVNRGPVTGESFLLHGGCGAALLWLVARGALATEASPLLAAVLTAGFLLANAWLQRRYEKTTGQLLYPATEMQHPAWRLVLVPLLGAALAAAIAASG